LLSSYQLGWEEIYVQHHQQPPGETPKICGLHHVVVVHHNQQVMQSERLFDKQRKKAQYTIGDIEILPANVQCQAICAKETEFTLLFLEPNFVARIAYESISPDFIEIKPHFPTADPLIYQIGLLLKSEIASKGVCSHLYSDSLKTNLAITLLRRYSVRKLDLEYNNRFSRKQLQQVVEYINDNLAEDLSLKAIASVAQMSLYHFARLFKQSTELTTHQYVNQRRIAEAKLLLSKQIAIADISQQVGF
jgi:AraC family transcriptional regulator